MEMNYIPLLILFLTLIVVDCAGTGLEVNVPPNTVIDLKSPLKSSNNSNSNENPGGSKSVIDSSNGDKVKKGEQVIGLKEAGQSNNNISSSNSSKQLRSQEDQKVKDVSKEVPEKDGTVIESGIKEKGNEESILKGVSKEEPKRGTAPPQRKESPRGEECESSNMCTDKNNALVACLRVPGNESPDLSLLIQNKGKGPLSVTISAPNFVQIEETSIQLQEKEDKKVKVSIRNGGTDNLIILTAGNGNCSLDFKDLILHNTGKEIDYSSQSIYNKLFKRIPAIAFIFLAALVVASAWMCVSFRRRHFSSIGSKYQALDAELPVSGGGKTESEVNDGWDNSWGDSWDDEEAPKTPSMPLTPSLSSKGLAPRRLNKEGWKD